MGYEDVTQILIKDLSNRKIGATSINSKRIRSSIVFTCVIESWCKRGLLSRDICYPRHFSGFLGLDKKPAQTKDFLLFTGSSPTRSLTIEIRNRYDDTTPEAEKKE